MNLKDTILHELSTGNTGPKSVADAVGCSPAYVSNIKSRFWKPKKAAKPKRAVKKTPKAKAKRQAAPQTKLGVPIGISERIVNGRRIVSLEFDLG